MAVGICRLLELHRVRQNSWHSSRTWCAQVQERCSMRAEKRITA